MEKKQQEELDNINGDSIVCFCILVGICISSIVTGIVFYKYIDSLFLLILMIIGIGIGGGGFIGTLVGSIIEAFFCES